MNDQSENSGLQQHVHLPSKTRWTVSPERLDCLTDMIWPFLEEHDSSATRIKCNRHRSLWFFPDGALFLKHHYPARFSTRLGQWWRGARARREWENQRTLEETGVRVAESIAWGFRESSHESYFVSAEIPHSEPLLDFLQEPETARSKQQVLHDLATQLALIHRHNWRVPDLHAGNILVCGGDVHFIDFHSSRPGGATRRSRISEWGSLFASIGHLLTMQQRTSLLEVYCGALGNEIEENFIYGVRIAEVKRLQHQYRAAVRRCAPISTGSDRRLYLNPEFSSLRQLVDQIPTDSSDVIQKAVRTRVLAIRRDDFHLVLKEYRDAGMKGLLRQWMGKARAERAFRALAGLRAGRVPTPRPVACRVAGDGPDYLWTEFVSDSQSLDRLLQEGQTRLSREQWLELARATAQLCARLHRMGLSHPDLTARNFLVTTRGRVRVWLVDFDGIRLKGHLARQIRISNLAQLFDATVPPRRRVWVEFVRAYNEFTRSTWLRQHLPSVASEFHRRQRRRERLAIGD